MRKMTYCGETCCGDARIAGTLTHTITLVCPVHGITQVHKATVTPETGYETRYVLMTTDQAPAAEIAAWMQEPEFAAYVARRRCGLT